MAGRASVALGLKYGTGDLISQHASKKSDDETLDYRRAGFFLMFGAYCTLLTRPARVHAPAHLRKALTCWPPDLVRRRC